MFNGETGINETLSIVDMGIKYCADIMIDISRDKCRLYILGTNAKRSGILQIYNERESNKELKMTKEEHTENLKSNQMPHMQQRISW